MARKSGKRGSPPPTPKQPKPWDVPPFPLKGDEEKKTVFAAVGSALSAWEGLEGQLAHIFAELVSPRQQNLAALRAYGSILTFRGRGELIEAAATATFFLRPDDSLKADLKKLVDEVQSFAARRNEIAHGRVTTYYRRPAGGIFVALRERPAGHILGPPEYATNKTKLKEGRVILEVAYHEPSYAYSSAELAAFEKHFKRLQDEARLMLLRIWRYFSPKRQA